MEDQHERQAAAGSAFTVSHDLCFVCDVEKMEETAALTMSDVIKQVTRWDQLPANTNDIPKFT